MRALCRQLRSTHLVLVDHVSVIPGIYYPRYISNHAVESSRVSLGSMLEDSDMWRSHTPAQKPKRSDRIREVMCIITLINDCASVCCA